MAAELLPVVISAQSIVYISAQSIVYISAQSIVFISAHSIVYDSLIFCSKILNNSILGMRSSNLAVSIVIKHVID